MSGKESKKGKPRRSGRRAAKIANYYAVNYVRNKLRRIFKRNGEAAALRWAQKKVLKHVNAMSMYLKMKNRMADYGHL